MRPGLRNKEFTYHGLILWMAMRLRMRRATSPVYLDKGMMTIKMTARKTAIVKGSIPQVI